MSRLMKFAIALVTMLLVTVGPAFSQSPPPAMDFQAIQMSKIAQAVRINEKINLDGRLEESVWDLAIPITDFVQNRPFNGQAPREKTEARILYDDANIYFGFRCFDS